MATRSIALLLVLILGISACARAPQPSRTEAPQTSAAGQSVPAALPGDPARKTVTIGIASAFYTFGLSDKGFSVGGGGALQELWLQGLVTSAAATPAPEPRIATELPSLDKGTVRVEPDGRMTVTWRLRDDVKWADGTPVTAPDFLFGYRVSNDERLTFPKSSVGDRIQSITAPDDHTLIMVWKEPYYLANAVGTGSGMQPLPRHALLDAYEAGNSEAFENHPYWTSQFFHIGPYRQVRFDPQTELVLQAVPGYFLGAPRVGNIIVKMFADTNTVYASLLAGAVDTAVGNALTPQLALELKQRWEASGEGKVLIAPGNSQLLAFQFAPEYQNEPAFLDPKVRQALFYAIDLPSWTESVMGGRASELVSTGMLPPNHYLSAYTKGSYGAYTLDVARSQRMLAEAGWNRGGDGYITHSSDGRRMKPVIWSTTESSIVIVADFWKRVGVDASAYVLPRSRTSDREFWQTLPNVELSSRGYGEEILDRIECRQSPSPANGYTAFNRGHYCNEAQLEPLVAGFKRSLTPAEQGGYLKQASELIAQDLPIIQTYFSLHPASVAKGLLAFDDFGGGLPGTGVYGSYFRNGHLWDRAVE